MFLWPQSANAHSDIETGNMQTVVQDDIITLCLWANLNKNPRHVTDACLTFVLFTSHKDFLSSLLANSLFLLKTILMDVLGKEKN